jgi:hypothetical protein
MIMMGTPTKFNNIESGAISSQPSPKSAEEINRLVNTRSLSDSLIATAGVNVQTHPIERPPATPNLPGLK